MLKDDFLSEKCFGPVLVEFTLTVPRDYNHYTQIDRSARAAKKEKTTYYYNEDFTSKNFEKASNKLEAGKIYKGKIFPLISRVTAEGCLNFLRIQNAILVGGQGMSLVYDLHREIFPKGKWTVSLDEENSLWRGPTGSRWVPDLNAYPDGDFSFALAQFGIVWHPGGHVLCICNE